MTEEERLNRLDSGMGATERGISYSIEEAEKVAKTYPDTYVREIIGFLLRRITRSSWESYYRDAVASALSFKIPYGEGSPTDEEKE